MSGFVQLEATSGTVWVRPESIELIEPAYKDGDRAFRYVYLRSGKTFVILTCCSF